MTTQIKAIIDELGMDIYDVSYALNISSRSLERMVLGKIPTPPGVVSDAIQLLHDRDYVRSLIKAHPEVQDISYKTFKYELDN